MKSKISVSTKGIGSFVEANKLNAFLESAKTSLIALREGKGRGNEFTGWLRLPDQAVNETGRVKACAARLRAQAPVTVVVGIGGSYLGAKALREALRDPFGRQEHMLVFAGHTLSEDYHAALLRFLDSTLYNIVVISKSGTTTEPAIAFRILRDHLRNKVGEKGMKSHIVAITDARRGALHNLAVSEGYETFVIPDDVGGRYSVLTPVGILPLALAGFDTDAFAAGMKDMAISVREGNDTASNIAIAYAAARNTLYHNGYTTEILISYEPSLVFLAEWWKQLYGESEGKESKGIFPSSVTFTTDLHSMGQYIQQGERKLFETVIHVEEPHHRLVVPGAADDSDGIGFIAGKTLSEVNHKAEAGTRIAHIEGGVPVITISLPRIDEYHLGQVMYFFELACAISGYVLGVNPFDQPGVESYKKNMFALLGKPGFEAERERLEKELKSNG
ncbi:glucose-6-phosphate isomerase [bacterium]|nr:glucose-6-phosphate isomerase [bacterium]